jgi:hypothetical protein
MKKITLAIMVPLMFFGYALIAQTFSTGLVTLTTSPATYSVQVDVTEDLVTLNMIGPANRWLALGFGTDNMISGEDVVIFDGTSFTDRYFGFPGQPAGQVAQGLEPSIDASQDWTLISNNVEGNVRTLVATRARDTRDSLDYIFNASASALQLAWAYSQDETFVLQWHQANVGTPLVSLTLSTDSFQNNNFSISPNPAKSRLNINLPNGMANAKVSVFNVLGKKVYSGDISNLNSSINISNWNSGVYLVKVSSNNITQTKRFIKQ